jgi:hypothetical protein
MQARHAIALTALGFLAASCGGQTSMGRPDQSVRPDQNVRIDQAVFLDQGVLPDGGLADQGPGCGVDVCPAGSVVVAGACCPIEQACPTVCCGSNSLCVTDNAGNMNCAIKCTTSNDCAQNDAAHPCCNLLSGGVSACVGYSAGATQCLCQDNSECTGFTGNTACAPVIDASGNPIGTTLACRPDDGQVYDGCNTVGCLGGASNCCVKDGAGNQYCARPCTATGQCGGGTCADNSVLDPSIGSCTTTPMFCGP